MQSANVSKLIDDLVSFFIPKLRAFQILHFFYINFSKNFMYVSFYRTTRNTRSFTVIRECTLTVLLLFNAID